MTAIVAFTGRKQCGKNSTANYLAGDVLVKSGVINRYEINDKGELLVPATTVAGIQMGVLDLSRQDDTFVRYASKLIWPHVKLYSFADPLKAICIELFGMSFEQCYGTNEQKETKTTLKWEDTPHYGRIKYQANQKKEKPPTGYMTAREVMQHLGTEVVRRWCNDAWVNAAIRRIEKEKPKVAMICDCRFPNEVAGVQNAGGKVIRLTRSVTDDPHESEHALDEDRFDWTKFDLVVDNKELTKFQTYQDVKKKLTEWGIV